MTTKRVLLICSYFSNPTHTGGFRWSSLARALAERGWTLDIISQYSADWPQHALYDAENITVYQVMETRWRVWLRNFLAARQRPRNDAEGTSAEPPTPSPLQPLKETLRAVAELVRDWSWVRRAGRTAETLRKSREYDAVIATSPLQLAQWLGARTASRAGVPYIADFRDPLYFGRGNALTETNILTRLSWRLVERYALRRMSVAVDISEKSLHEVQAALPFRPADVPRRFIPSGYESREETSRPNPNQFRIVFTGWLYPFDEIAPLFAAAARLRHRHELMPDELSIDFMGTADHHNGVPLMTIAARHGLADHFHQSPRQPREVADRLQQDAAVLVAFDSVTSNALCIPSKLYHYAPMYGDLLLLGMADGAMALEAAKIGVEAIRPSDQTRIDAALERAFDRWRRADYATTNDPHELFHFRHSAEKMHQLLLAVSR